MQPGTEPKRTTGSLRWLPLAAVGLVLAAGYAAGLHRYFTFEALEHYRDDLAEFVEANGAASAAAYVAAYAAAVAVSFPGAGILTAAGGFMFGPFLGTVLAVIAATTGSTLFFLIARTSLGSFLSERAGPRLLSIRDGFQAEGISYLLFLRLVPAFPFWLVNLAAAAFGMKLAPYVLATLIGIIPGTFVYAYFGSGLDEALTEGSPLVPWKLLVALALLGLMAIVPVAWRRLRRHRS
jgi:uncharacterized membrane protein YdjX (TVP38/TMEM64 family)